MSYSNIDATLSDADLQAVRAAFAEIISKLPFLINLTNLERRRIHKAGPDSLSFLQNALATAQANTTIFPPSFDTAGFARDVKLFEILTDLQTVSEQLASQIDDTRLAVGGEAMEAATQTYKYVTTAAKTTPGLKPVAELLGERFRRATRKKGSGSSNTGSGGEGQG